MKEKELRIYYKLKGRAGLLLDARLKKEIENIGYSFYASGYDIRTGIRDLAFIKKGN